MSIVEVTKDPGGDDGSFCSACPDVCVDAAIVVTIGRSWPTIISLCREHAQQLYQQLQQLQEAFE